MLLLLTTLSAHAAGYFFTDSGTRALGRGTAYVAGADDLSAQYYNPAALTRLTRSQFMLDVTGVSQYVYFKRADDPYLGEFSAVENEGQAFEIPNFGVSTNFGVPGLTAALGFYTPMQPDTLYPEEGPQRYILIDAYTMQTYAGPSLAYRVRPWLSLGLGLEWGLFRALQKLDIGSCLKSPAEAASCGDEPENDISVAMAVNDNYEPSWNAGVLIEPTDWLAIGFSVQPPIDYSAEGTVDVEFAEEGMVAGFLESTTIHDDFVTMDITFPLILRAGVAMKPTEELEIEVSAVHQRWSRIDTLVVNDVNLYVDVTENSFMALEDIEVTDPIELKVGMVDATSLRLGAEYDINDIFVGRAGGFLEQSAIPPKTVNVNTVDGPKYGYTAGASVNVRDRITLDAAFAQARLKQRNITDSDVTMLVMAIDIVSPEDTALVDGKVVGNGKFKSTYTMLSAGATVYFGKTTE